MQIAGLESLPKVFAITLNWNRKEDTASCIRSLRKMSYPNFEIVAIDNGSEDGSVAFLKQEFGDDIHIVANEKNLGYAEGFNSGINYAMEKGADYLFILNNDTKIDPEALTELVTVARRDETIGFVSGKVYYYDDTDVLQTVGKRTDPVTIVGPHVGEGETDTGQYEEEKDYEFMDDIYLLVRRVVVETVGIYSPEFFLYFEETDWCARVRRAGYRIVYTPKAKIWHKGSLSSGGGTNPVNTYWNARNRYVFIWRNGTKKQRKDFLLRNFFITIPRTVVVRLARFKFKLLSAFIKGNCSGLMWVLKKGKKVREES